jgi:hypothetical protein
MLADALKSPSGISKFAAWAATPNKPRSDKRPKAESDNADP